MGNVGRDTQSSHKRALEGGAWDFGVDPWMAVIHVVHLTHKDWGHCSAISLACSTVACSCPFSPPLRCTAP